jgi:hypothetical protein
MGSAGTVVQELVVQDQTKDPPKGTGGLRVRSCGPNALGNDLEGRHRQHRVMVPREETVVTCWCQGIGSGHHAPVPEPGCRPTLRASADTAGTGPCFHELTQWPSNLDETAS